MSTGSGSRAQGRPHAFFDVFDTCLTRKWILPTDLFHALHERLTGLPGMGADPAIWTALRIECEAQARAGHPAEEPDLPAIYRQIAGRLGWPKAAMEAAMREEIELESGSLVAVPEMKQYVNGVRASGTAVVFISDTYHSSKTVTRFLVEQGVSDGTDKVYVSCEAGASKNSGALFDLVLRETGAWAQNVVHIGDNFHSDIKVPRRKGLRIRPFTDCRPTRYERLVRSSGSLKLASIVPGASRLARLDGYGLDNRSKAIWDASSDVVGPLLFGFVVWCMERARGAGLKRLYFVSRDGQVLLKIADVLRAKWGFDIECRYLYGSRQAWHAGASYDPASHEGLSWLFENTYFLSVASVLRRADVAASDAEPYLSASGFGREVWNQNLSAPRRATLQACFLSDGMKRLLEAAAGEHRRKALAFLRQEGLADGVACGIVDIGWNGRLHRSLARLLRLGGIAPPGGLHGLYFGLECESRPADKDPLGAYFYAAGRPPQRAKLCQNKALFELFVAADTGGVIGYEERDGKIVPLLESGGGDAGEWGIDRQQAAVVKFSEYLAETLHQSEANGGETFAAISEVLLDPFVTEPSPEEAEAYGSFRFAEDQTHVPLYELAPRLSTRDALDILLRRGRKHNHLWIAASARRSGGAVGTLLHPRVMLLRERLKEMLGW